VDGGFVVSCQSPASEPFATRRAMNTRIRIIDGARKLPAAPALAAAAARDR
jgi:hypothetical protein